VARVEADRIPDRSATLDHLLRRWLEVADHELSAGLAGLQPQLRSHVPARFTSAARPAVVRVLHSDDDVPVAVPVPFPPSDISRDERTGQETSWLTMPDFFGTG
jgi:hypothetical protein